MHNDVMHNDVMHNKVTRKAITKYQTIMVTMLIKINVIQYIRLCTLVIKQQYKVFMPKR